MHHGRSIETISPREIMATDDCAKSIIRASDTERTIVVIEIGAGTKHGVSVGDVGHVTFQVAGNPGHLVYVIMRFRSKVPGELLG